MNGWLATLLAVAGAGAAGGICRFWISSLFARRFGERFPWGTLAVNATGAAAIGIVAGVALRGDAVPEGDRLVWTMVVIGFLGSYTTVSSFSLQMLGLARAGETGRAALYAALSLGLCLMAAAIGMALVGPGT